jgi:hypothetical protein
MMERISVARPQDGDGRSVFVSYRTLDDVPPPEKPDGKFVSYLSQQIKWELSQLGVPKAILWRDRAGIEPGDIWSAKIQEALARADLFLAIVSRNYVTSDWCNREVSTMASRMESETNQTIRRMLRVDRHRVKDDLIPEPLRSVQAVRFYQEDAETNQEDEFYWRGQVCRYDEYVGAVRALARSIYNQLEMLGAVAERTSPSPVEPATRNVENPRHDGEEVTSQVVFVAKPATDLLEEYRCLTNELVQRGYRVLPDPSISLPEDCEQVKALTEEALTQSILSVHLLGERKGVRPDGLEQDLVPFQLSAAASRVATDSNFYRLIWAPKIMPRSHQGDSEQVTRDPIDVLTAFGDRCASDQIDGDTATRFNEFVLQRVAGHAMPATRPDVYIYSTADDRRFSIDVARALKSVGATPLLGVSPGEGSSEQIAQAERELLRRARCVVVCWAGAKRAQIISEIVRSEFQEWKNDRNNERKLILLIAPPGSESKVEAVEFGIGSQVDWIIDAHDATDLRELLREQLVSKIASES